MHVHTTITEFGIESSTQVEPTDIIDALNTLSPSHRVEIEIPAPGPGPEYFLDWCKAELEEADNAEQGPDKLRKSFNVSVLAKCAVECLLDWYLSRHLLQLTIAPTAGLVQKLDALNAEELLGIGLSLFDDNLFGPRNTAIHDYEPVSFGQAKKAFQLANLSVRNCMSAVPPNLGPVFFGNLKIARNEDVQQYSERELKIDRDRTAFYFGGLADDERNGVFIHRSGRHSRIAVLAQLDNDTEIRYASVTEFSPDQLRTVIARLESTSPAPIDLTADEKKTIFDTVLGANDKSGTPSW